MSQWLKGELNKTAQMEQLEGIKAGKLLTSMKGLEWFDPPSSWRGIISFQLNRILQEGKAAAIQRAEEMII